MKRNNDAVVDLTNDPSVKMKKPAKEKKEKRLKRIRSKAPEDLIPRIERALSQRMFLIARTGDLSEESESRGYAVLGSTGNVYGMCLYDNLFMYSHHY